MWNRYFEPGDLEDRRALKAVDTAQLIITGTLLISTLVIVQYFDTCNEKGRAWYYTLLYGNLFWIFYLFTSLIGKYKNDMVKRFFAIIDYFFYIFHLIMLLWNYVLWTHKDQYLGSNYISCSDAANYFADCYRYLGYFFLAVLAVGLIGLGCSRIRPKEDLKEMHFETSNLNENNNRGAVSQYGRRPPTNEKPDPLSAPGEKNRR